MLTTQRGSICRWQYFIEPKILFESEIISGEDTSKIKVCPVNKDAYNSELEKKHRDELQYGNVFYDEGLVVTVDTPVFSSYNLNFRSTQTIYETEVLITAKAGEFNYSQNPSAVSDKAGLAENAM